MREAGFVTVFCPFTTTGATEMGLQAMGEERLVVDCRVKPAAFVGQVKVTVGPEELIVNCGGATGSSMLKRVPEPELPPPVADP